jgi:hypothetical protein
MINKSILFDSTFSTSFDDDTTCVGNKFLDGSIRDGDTDTDETLGTERDE